MTFIFGLDFLNEKLRNHQINFMGMFLSFLILIFKHVSVLPGFDPRTPGVLIQLYLLLVWCNIPVKSKTNKFMNMYFKGHKNDIYV